ncbi:MAG: hypothetical protein P8Y97_16110, partial [Candidatus Lokiarchaeota archaeon]
LGISIFLIIYLNIFAFKIGNITFGKLVIDIIFEFFAALIILSLIILEVRKKFKSDLSELISPKEE